MVSERPKKKKKKKRVRYVHHFPSQGPKARSPQGGRFRTENKEVANLRNNQLKIAEGETDGEVSKTTSWSSHKTENRGGHPHPARKAGIWGRGGQADE